MRYPRTWAALLFFTLALPSWNFVQAETPVEKNVRLCLTGRYPALCDHSKLTAEEATRARAAEVRENTKRCLAVRRPCDRSKLTTTELREVRLAEAKQGVSVPAPEAKPAPVPSSKPASGRTRLGDCESGHWIDSVEGDGKIVKLEDGSLWRVDEADAIIASLWLPISDVIVCSGKLLNVDADGESVSVTPIGSQVGTRQAPSPEAYLIQASANDETFIVNGEVFKAQTFCFGFEKGDRVEFVSGSPTGACVSAELLNLRTGKVCRVWCE